MAADDFLDYYKLLGFSGRGDFSADELRTNYRKLASELHPDRNKDPKAEEQLKDINLAYNVLSDPERRARYDQIYDYRDRGGRGYEAQYRDFAHQPDIDFIMQEIDRQIREAYGDMYFRDPFVVILESDQIPTPFKVMIRAVRAINNFNASRIEGIQVVLTRNDINLVSGLLKVNRGEVRPSEMVVNDERGMPFWKLGFNSVGQIASVQRSISDLLTPDQEGRVAPGALYDLRSIPSTRPGGKDLRLPGDFLGQIERLMYMGNPGYYNARGFAQLLVEASDYTLRNYERSEYKQLRLRDIPRFAQEGQIMFNGEGREGDRRRV